MKIKTGIIILVVACVGLVIALLVLKKQADDEQKKDADAMLDFSNQLTTATANLDDLRQVNLMLTNDLATTRQQILSLSNSFNETSNALNDAKSLLQNAQSQITNLNDHITDLQAQNQALDERANSLSNTLASLNMQIAETQEKLAHSETNNAFLTAQLKEQMAQKAELEHKFNDLNDVRSQVRKLRDELLAARRLEWMRAGTDPTMQYKGAQLLMQHAPPAPAAPVANKAAPNRSSLFDLNVEIGSDGSVHVTPATTNAPAVTNTPAH
jgi:DNA repair exonuclease SbcCD ATPase subunit